MSTYPIVKIAGINLSDPSGRWDVLPGTSILPHFPGRAETRVPTPGVPGYRGVAYAPGESMKIAIVLRFNAVETYANEIVPGGSSERTAAIHRNIDTFFYATALARQGYAGLVEIYKEVHAGEPRVTAARMVASSELEFDPGKDYATMTMIFEAPAGVWLDEKYTIYQSVAERSFSVQQMEIPSGTAPQTENVVAFQGPYTANTGSNRISFANELDIGFEVGFSGAGVSMAAGDWMLINTQTWRNGYQRGLSQDGYPKLSWGMGKSFTQIHPKGRSLGNALTLLPSVERGTAILRYKVPNATKVQIRTRRAWY